MVQRLEVEFKLNVAVLNRWLEQQGKGATEGLAYAVGVTASTIDKIRGRERLPNGEHLAAIAFVTKIPVADLIVRVPKKKSA